MRRLRGTAARCLPRTKNIHTQQRGSGTANGGAEGDAANRFQRPTRVSRHHWSASLRLEPILRLM